MEDSIQVAVFEGGKLRVLSRGEKSDEAVLSLPLKRLLVKVIRVPKENREAIGEYILPIVSALSPYPDEELTVAYEKVREDENELVVSAAALPESSAEDIGMALDEAKLSVTKIDATVFGMLSALWTRIVGEDVASGDARRLVAIKDDDSIALIVLDGDMPVAMKAISNEAAVKRETMLLLLEAEDFNGAKALNEVVQIGVKVPLEEFGKVRTIELGEDEADVALEGVMARAGDVTALDALPDSWREQLEEKRFKSKLIKSLAIAGGIWALIMGVLFGVPMVYGFMTDHEKTLSKEHSRQYNQVKTMKAKVDLVKRYSDHQRGALAMMKLVSDSLPLPEGEVSDCITLGSFSYDRDNGLSISGEAKANSLIYEFDDKLAEYTDLFAEAPLNGPSKTKDKFRFSIECPFIEDGEGME